MRIFDFESWPVDFLYPGFHYFKAAGSGYGTLLDLMPALHEGIPSRNLNKLERGIATAVLLSSSLLSTELLSHLSLQDLFGVGYEIVHPLGEKLAKFDSLTYAFWTAEEVNSDAWRMLRFPFLTFNYSYNGDILVIRVVRASSMTDTDSCKIDSDELHVISPIHKVLNPDELRGYSPQSLNAEWMCNVFLWKNLQGNTGIYSTLGHFPDKSSPIIWTNEFSPNAEIVVNTQLVQTVISKIAQESKVASNL